MRGRREGGGGSGGDGGGDEERGIAVSYVQCRICGALAVK